MARYMQMQGLNHRAIQFLHENGYVRSGVSKYKAMDIDGSDVDLIAYKNPAGNVIHQYVQESPWSSGPMVFLAIKDTDGNVINESLWSDTEIDRRVDGDFN